MLDAPTPAPPDDRLLRLPDPLVLALIALYCTVEVILQGADRHLWGSVLWRPLANQNGGFWAGLMRGGWLANYPGQTAVMFFTHSVLHAGLSHLLGNMAALVALANLIGGRLPRTEFLALWIASALAGALAFALLGPVSQPMVGTSGALFGLAGLLVAWEVRSGRAAGLSLPRVMLSLLIWVLGLALLNLACWWLQNGVLAWQAHLGGFIAGLLWGLLRPQRLAKTLS